MKLFFSPGACSMAAHIVLEELGAKYDTQKVDLRNKDPEYVKLNPKGYVPALKTDDGKVLTENVAVLEFLGDQKPEKNMMPKAGTWDRYKATELLAFISTEIHKGFSPLFMAAMMHPNDEKAQNEMKEGAKKKIATRFDLIEQKLKGNQFLLGDHMSVADAYFFVMTVWSKKHQLEMSRWPSIMSFAERMQGRPAIQKVMQAEGLM